MLRLKYHQLNIDYDQIFDNIKDIIIKSLITIQPHVCNKLAKTGYQQNQCFDLFGFDILIDECMKPWLLEVNMSPSLSCAAKLDKQIKTGLLCDTFNLVGIPYSTNINTAKPTQRKNANQANKLFNPYLDVINESTQLSEKDIKLLIGLDEELRRKGNYERIFPLRSNWDQYSKYFECERYSDYLLWKYLSSNCDILAKYRIPIKHEYM